jgi:hypothetical protein
MNNETFIPMQDVINRINTHPDITKEVKKEFKHITDLLYMTDRRKEQTFKPITKNQKRNQNK